MTYVLISLFVLASYVISVCVRWGVPESVSQTFFSIRHKWIFSFVMVAASVLLAVSLFDGLPEIFRFIGFFTVGGMLLIGVAPNLNDEMDLRVHMTGAILLAVGSQMIVAVLQPYLLIVWLAFFIARKNKVFWAEMIGGLTLYGAIITDYLV